jgi:hypothetical protein
LRIDEFADEVLDKRNCVLGGFGCTFRARYRTKQALVSASARAELLALALVVWVTSALVERGHTVSRHESIAGGDGKKPASVAHVAARLLIRDAVVKALQLDTRVASDSPPGGAPRRRGGRQPPATDAAAQASRRKTRYAKTWTWRVYLARGEHWACGTRGAYKTKATLSFQAHT